jgi:hypothetical protein
LNSGSHACYLNHVLSPFFVCYFCSLVFLSGAGLELWFSYLCLPCSWDYSCEPSHSACLLRWGLANLCLGWPQTIMLLISSPQIAVTCYFDNISPWSHANPPNVNILLYILKIIILLYILFNYIYFKIYYLNIKYLLNIRHII